ncbi:metal-dependent transcriptional regulator [Polaribacter sp.]|jgi:DtxR family Mn-dependent transcriptional regulator|nr:metal-dependent transcriptional regulator [Polaribacter sp.]MBT7704570.1 metal-dependent transcriptional regulator [Polaribacter sp.]MDA9234811.1 metal-dependent transcriptional regulator [Polaribacter sp.]MDA9277402.1 metal-dependent transcriptional regulator [Polaribacter sp.]MDA9968603.1 metal-dependent transcriptional regulator [Polaribacter sp.]
MFTLSEENYLKTIYHLGLNSEIGVSTNEIAKKMQTKASSVTDMIKKLSDKNLVVYKKYKGVRITDFGRNTAANIVRKHRLWEVFLVEKLNFSWDEVHEVAEQLEHIKSPKLINELDALLGFPKQDPHGDPIPDKEGNYYPLEKKLLATLGLGEKGICVGVNDSSSSFLQFLDKQKIALGNEIKVLGKEPFDDSIQIQIANRELSISNKIANNLYIKIL